jgi:hypothetical protein
MSRTSFLNQMKTQRNTKAIISSITLVAILAISIFAVQVPTASAHTPPLSIPMYAYINAFPSPIGVGQTISLFAWTATYPPTASGEYGDHWTNLTITVTLPDGSNKTLGPFESDPVGTIFATYVPTTSGNYSFTFHMPAYKITDTNPQFPITPPTYQTGLQYLGDTFQAADSAPVTVQVTNEAIPAASSYPLPSQYWTNPVGQSGHANWGYIMGDWLAAPVPGSSVNDFTDPPTTAHIAWTKPINFGGVGGQPTALNSGGDNYYSYLSYEGMFAPPILMNGRLYYNTPNPPEYGFICLDLRTGQQLWYNNGTQDPLASQQLGFGFDKQNYPQLSFGQELDYESPNQHGLIDYLWATYTAKNGSSVWAMYDPFTGNWICDIVGVPAGAGFFGASSQITDAIGSYLIFSATPDFKTVTVWNSTQCIQNTNPSLTTSNGYWLWRPPLGGLIDARSGNTVYNTTGVPAAFQQAGIVNGPFGPSFSNSMGLSLLAVDAQNQIAIYSNASAVLGISSYPTPSAIASMGISIAPGSIGQYKWSQISPYPAGNVTLLSGFAGYGVYTLYNKEKASWIAYSSTTGQQIWTSDSEVSNHVYGITGGIYNGVLYSGDSIGEGGIIYAYNATTGTLLWQTSKTPMGFTGYWDAVPMSVGTFAADNLYWYGSEHSPGPNLEQGFMMGDINATTGQSIWNISFWSGGGGFGAGIPTADGYLTALNIYDNQIYSFGKGPTATTLQVPLTAITSGQSVVIQGTVMDISAGTQQDTIAPRFPNGVPAVSDNSQTAWMEYVYMQNPAPANVVGVPVTLTFIDANGNTHVTTATTDATGAYSIVVPSDIIPVEGKYTVVASFDGSHAYWPSSSTLASFAISSAPSSTVTPTPNSPTSPIDSYFLPAVAAIIIILIVGIALIMIMLRRRP